MRGILSGWFGWGPAASTQSSGTAAPEQWLFDLFGGTMTATGVRVSPELAMSVPAIEACVNIFAEDLAKVPLLLLRRSKGGGKERATDHPLYHLLQQRASPWMPAFHFRRALIAAAVQRGNGFARIWRDERGYPYRLTPLKASRTTTRWTSQGEPFFDADSDGRRVTLPYHEMIHVPFRPDVEVADRGGIFGVSPIARHPETVALAVATERFAAAFFKNGARPSAVIEMDKTLPNDAVAARIRAGLERLYSGVDNAFRIAVLELGMKLKEFSFSNSDSQLMEVRKELAVECCRIFGVPPHKIGILDRATFSNIEHQAIDYVTGPLSALAKNVEMAISLSCLSRLEAEELVVEHDLNGLLRGDIKTRYEAFAKARQWGWLNVDEIREFENMNPLPDGAGKIYLSPLNMVPANDTDSEPKPEDEQDPRQPRRSSLIGHNGGPLFY